MIFSYFDSSVLLAIVLDEARQAEAYEYWQNSMRVSSILLKIETFIVLRRMYENNKKKLGAEWLKNKTKLLEKFLFDVNYKILGNKIEQEIHSRKEMARCKSLDAIHVATAMQFREMNPNGDTHFYTFDKTMHDLAKYYKFKTNKL